MATPSVKDIISSAIGATNVTTDESGNASYGSWSPNSVRSLIVSSNFVMVEWFPGSSMAKARKGRFTIKTISAPAGYFAGDALPDPISPVLKKYGYRNIEEIVVDSKYGCSASSLAAIQLKGATNLNDPQKSVGKYADAATFNENVTSKVSETVGWGTIRGNMGNTRLRSVTVFDFPEQVNVVQLQEQLSEYRRQCDSGEVNDVNSLTAALMQMGLPVVDAANIYPENDRTYLNCFTLSPSRYDADSKDKGLHKYLTDSANIAEGGEAGSDGEGAGEDGFDESLFHTIIKESAKASVVAEKCANKEGNDSIPADKLQSIVKLLKLVASHKKGEKPSEDMRIPSMSFPTGGHGVFGMDDPNKVLAVGQCAVELFGGAPNKQGDDDKSLAKWYEGIVGRVKHDYPGLFDDSLLKEDNKGSFNEALFYPMLKVLATAKKRVEADAESAIDANEQSELLAVLGIFTAHNEGKELPAELPIISDAVELGGRGVFGMDSNSKLEAVQRGAADLLGECADVPEDKSDTNLLKWYDSVAKGLYRKYPQYFKSKEAAGEESSDASFDEAFYPVISQAIEASKATSGIKGLSRYDEVIDKTNESTVRNVLIKLFDSISSHIKGRSVPDEFKGSSRAVELPEDNTGKNGHGVFFMDSEYKVNQVKSLYAMLKKGDASDVQFPALPATDETKDETKGALKAAYQGIIEALRGDYPAAFGGEESGIEDIIRENLGMMINGKVTAVLESYDNLFEAGYDLERPYSILGSDEIQYVSAQGGTIEAQSGNDLSILVKDLWNAVSPYMGIFPSQTSSTRDYKEVAEAPAGTYMPTLMAAMAYGYYPREHGGPTGIHEWSSYRDKIVRPFLEQVFERVAVNTVKDSATDVSSIVARRGDIEAAITPVMDNLQKCVLVSNLNITKSSGYNKKFVSMKVKVLAPEGVDVEAIRSGVFQAVASSTDKSVLDKGKTIAEQSGRYIEINFVADQVQDNAFPLFAYKALDSLKKQGKSFEPSLNSVLLGKDSKGRLLKAGKDINFNNVLTHYILAGSRSGKGVMTLNILAGGMDGVTPLAYADNKPDMLSMLKAINPNVYGINGESCISNPADGNDLFNQFANPDSEVNWDNVPDYLVKYGYIDSKSYTSVGNIFYVRFMMLTMGIIAARVNASHFKDRLGGKNGITVVFDEFANATKTFQAMCRNWKTMLAPSRPVNEVLKALREGGDLEEVMADKGSALNPGMFWATAYLQSIEDSVSYLQLTNNAGANSEKMCNNIFVLGQHALSMEKSFSLPGIRPANAGSQAIELTDDAAGNLLTGLTRMGDADAFLGASEAVDDFLYASNPRAEKANSYLNRTTRGFAYIKSIGGDAGKLYAKRSGAGTKEERVSFSNKQLYFKPFLLLESAGMEEYPVRNMLKFMESSVGLQGRQDFVASNSEENNPEVLNNGVSFLGYLKQAGIGEDAVYNQLQKAADIANWIVQEGLGYPGTWKDFVYDLRPQWIFSSKDIGNALSKSSNASDMSASAAWFNSDERFGAKSVLKDMRILYPDYMPDFSKESSGDYMGNLSDLESGFGNSMGDSADAGDFSTTQVIPVIQPESFTPEQQPVGIPENQLNPFDNMEMPIAAETTPVDEMQLVTASIVRKLGGFAASSILEANLRGIKISGEPLQVSGVAQPQAKVNWAELLRKGYVAELNTTSNYINQYIAPAMGWSKCSVDSFFKESPALGILTVDGRQYSRMDAAQPQPVVESWQDPKSALNGSSMGSWFNRPDSGASAGQQGAANDLFQAGINRGKESFRNGGAVRKGAAAALGIAGLGLMTGGASTALLCSLAVWPPAWGLVGVLAAVKMYRGGRRRSY